ncbi:MAG: hypothetical protein A3C07_03660 [Candidatus Sungbacteria bacterium RIFCSPHIGHO2_02_FULL_47_11]|uniref:Twin-arginine translocation signal domain-containing protein n=1 Tax=Candidatus Sungbacteria bacterium RIFCSPHIGHO2_02_FULL_47_11 TaxID=1802270 RepID=A0A1G2KLJ4_9BACT|nr:MAG: hypothetical protein A3C07_03660 [Candidatus Sungbacteria bacterium RIFCSPHIGHO2_02_FULL_47_11]
MPEQAGFESGSRSFKKENKKAGFTRRKFLTFTGAATLTAGFAGSASEKKLERDKTPAEQIRGFNDAVEREKRGIQSDIALGFEKLGVFNSWLDEYTRLKDESRHLDPESDAYKEAKRKIDDVYEVGRGFYEERGTSRLKLLDDAIPFGKKLSVNDAALTALATARTLYRGVISRSNPENKGLPYWHNVAAAYLELQSVSKEQVVKKIGNLFKYANFNQIDVSTIPTERITYSLIDNTFDFSLSPVALEVKLNETFPTRKQYPPTHKDKNSYASYNDLSVLGIFELNRLKAVITQLEDRNFVARVFKYRDEDVKDTRTGFGGVIPLPLKGYHLQAIPADTVGDNNRYVVPDKALVEMFAGAATFRFNATRMNEPTENQGPSADDEAFFAPGVVFSSIDESKILVHFFTSIELGNSSAKGFVAKEVVCLGVIERPVLPLPEDRNRKRYLPPMA